MKKAIFIILLIALAITMTGCIEDTIIINSGTEETCNGLPCYCQTFNENLNATECLEVIQ